MLYLISKRYHKDVPMTSPSGREPSQGVPLLFGNTGIPPSMGVPGHAPHDLLPPMEK